MGPQLVPRRIAYPVHALSHVEACGRPVGDCSGREGSSPGPPRMAKAADAGRLLLDARWEILSADRVERSDRDWDRACGRRLDVSREDRLVRQVQPYTYPAHRGTAALL